ncbi:MAG: hypothetical protein AAGK25_04855, partial [Pseudomonadota bacterium]
MTYRFRSFACLLASFFVVQGALSQTPPTQPGPGAVEGQSPIPVPAGAPSVPPGETIVGLVNDEVITSFDLRQRIKLILLSSGGQIRPEQVPQLQQQALRDL